MYQNKVYNYHCKKGEVYMYNDKINLTKEDIYEKEFKIDARGYRPQEVDKFLDIVMHDYMEYDHMLLEYQKEIKALTLDIQNYKQEIRRLKTMLESQENVSNDGANNVDMLRRISNLEKIVFGKNE